MTDTGLYGIVLYHTMCRMKLMTPCKKRRRELTYYLDLWSFALNLLQDEIANGTDNSPLLKEYLKAYKSRFYPLDLERGTNIDSVCSRRPPVQAVSAMVRLVSQLQIQMSDIDGSSEQMWRELHALHNLPRCLLPLHDSRYKSEKDVMEWSMGYVKK